MMKPDRIIDEASVLGGYSKWKDRYILTKRELSIILYTGFFFHATKFSRISRVILDP